MHGLGYDSMWCVVGCGVYSVRPKERPVNTSYGFFFFSFCVTFYGAFTSSFLRWTGFAVCTQKSLLGPTCPFFHDISS